MEMKNQKKYFNPHSAFFSLPVVYWTIILGSSIILIISALIIHYGDCYLDLSSSGFNDLLTMFKMPIATLGFFAALLALYATNHRSEQNKASMELTDAQNKFSNYYKHLEEFEEYVNNHFSEQLKPLKPIIKINKLHKVLYGNAKRDGITLSLRIEKEILKNLFKLVESVAKTNFTDNESIKLLILKSDDLSKNLLDTFSNSISFTPEDSKKFNININGRVIEIYDPLLNEFLKYNAKKIQAISDTLYFDENFDENLIFESLIRHSFELIERIPAIITNIGNETFTVQINTYKEIEINKKSTEILNIFKQYESSM